MRLLCLGDVAVLDQLPFSWSVPECIRQVTQDDRILFNWEIPIGDALNPQPRLGGGPRMITSSASVSVLREWSPGFVSLATNHILDAGDEGLRKTLEILRESGFKIVGAGLNKGEISTPIIWETTEGKLGIINWVFPETHPEWDTEPGPNCWPGYDEATISIKMLKSNVDWILAILHWSNEDFSYPRPEDREIASKLIQIGADVIIGHHPHVVRGMEIINGSPVFYSLGNLFFSAIRSPSGDWVKYPAPMNREGLGVELIFRRGMKPEYQLHSFWQTKTGFESDHFHRATRRARNTSKVLEKFKAENYREWYFKKRRAFDKVGIYLHFRLWQLGFRGLIRRVTK